MTQEEIVKKAFDAYPHRPQMVIINNGFGRTSIGDLNDDKRKGYIKALTEIESFPKIHGWVARDGDGTLRVHGTKPDFCDMGNTPYDRFWRTEEGCDIELPKEFFGEILNCGKPVEVELLFRRV